MWALLRVHEEWQVWFGSSSWFKLHEILSMFVYMIRLKVWCAVHIHVDWLVIEKCFIQGQSRSDRWSHYPNPNRKINPCTHPSKHSDFSLSFICLCDWTLFSLSFSLCSTLVQFAQVVIWFVSFPILLRYISVVVRFILQVSPCKL